MLDSWRMSWARTCPSGAFLSFIYTCSYRCGQNAWLLGSSCWNVVRITQIPHLLIPSGFCPPSLFSKPKLATDYEITLDGMVWCDLGCAQSINNWWELGPTCQFTWNFEFGFPFWIPSAYQKKDNVQEACAQPQSVQGRLMWLIFNKINDQSDHSQ